MTLLALDWDPYKTGEIRSHRVHRHRRGPRYILRAAAVLVAAAVISVVFLYRPSDDVKVVAQVPPVVTQPTVTVSPPASPKPVALPPTKADRAQRPPPPKPKPPADPWSNPPPVPNSLPGLDHDQTQNAFTVVWEGGRAGLGTQAKVIAMATALQESNLYIYANPYYPESLEMPHQRVGYDHDSVGIFQQRPSMGWGSVAECMNPAFSSKTFYSRLVQVPGWDRMSVTQAAQAVQRSGFPDAYARHEAFARQIVKALDG